MKPELTIDSIKDEAAKFAGMESCHDEPVLYGVTDGKAIGTYLEHLFLDYLSEKFCNAVCLTLFTLLFVGGILIYNIILFFL